MTLRGTVNAGTWIVDAITSPVPHGGFHCRISITQSAPAPEFGHAFAHHRTFESEEAAVLDGLREGMAWIKLKSGHVFQMQAEAQSETCTSAQR